MGMNRRELLPIEETKRKRISFTGVSRLLLIITTFQRLCANCVQGVSVCKKKAATRLLVTAWFSLLYVLWTSLGLNQGPPDYETLILTLYKADCQHINYLYVSPEVNNRSTLNLPCKVNNNSSYQELNHCFLLYPNAEFYLYVYLPCNI